MNEPRNQPAYLYKILSKSDYLAFASLRSSPYAGTIHDGKDGFIHLSTSKQIPTTLKKFYSEESVEKYDKLTSRSIAQ
ncbi:hypothetical protein SeMB42_g04960 [Synchytrium endobioticum]|nr:hypothetical protein SeMB42_g04960 [Synchytrium endobioticum]